MTFREHLTEIIREANSQSGTVRVQAVDAATATRAMLDQAAEVAAASEQSALAMREAAQTAAGLIRAIEEARSEVETSAEIANRAASQAGHAVETTASLSHHAKAIEIGRATSELQSLMRISYAVSCLNKKQTT